MAVKLPFPLFLRKSVVVLCTFGLIGFAFGFSKWFGQWVLLPWFPNALDSVFIGVSACVLGVWAWRSMGAKS